MGKAQSKISEEVLSGLEKDKHCELSQQDTPVLSRQLTPTIVSRGEIQKRLADRSSSVPFISQNCGAGTKTSTRDIPLASSTGTTSPRFIKPTSHTASRADLPVAYSTSSTRTTMALSTSGSSPTPWASFTTASRMRSANVRCDQPHRARSSDHLPFSGAFSLYDIDRSGAITRKEMLLIVESIDRMTRLVDLPPLDEETPEQVCLLSNPLHNAPYQPVAADSEWIKFSVRWILIKTPKLRSPSLSRGGK